MGFVGEDGDDDNLRRPEVEVAVRPPARSSPASPRRGRRVRPVLAGEVHGLPSVPASDHLYPGSVESISAMPWRTRAWSSARSTLIGRPVTGRASIVSSPASGAG